MRRRLRKKKRLGEFRELGFTVQYRAGDCCSNVDIQELLWSFLTTALEPNGLAAGGGGDVVQDLFVTLDQRRGSTSDMHRECVAKWLRENPSIIAWRIGRYRDSWHDESVGTGETEWVMQQGNFV